MIINFALVFKWTIKACRIEMDWVDFLACDLSGFTDKLRANESVTSFCPYAL